MNNPVSSLSRLTDPVLHQPSLQRWLVVIALVLTFLFVVGGLYFAILFPVCVSLILAYLLLPMVRLLERLHMSRGIAVTLMLIALFTVVSIAVSQIIPLVMIQIKAIIQLAPEALQRLLNVGLPGLKRYILRERFLSEADFDQALADLEMIPMIAGHLQSAATGVLYSTPRVFSGLVDLTLIPILTVFFLLEEKRLKKGLLSLIPVDMIEPVLAFTARADRALKSVIKGQINVAMILGLIYTIGLPSVGLEAGAAIGVVAGVCRIIPYVDVIVGGLLSAIVIIYTGASAFTAFGTVAIFAGAQTLDAILITPRVIGDRVGLHPLIVMLSVLSFGYWLGFYGVLLAIPLLALGKVTVDMFLPYYLNSAAYRPREEGAPQ